LNWISLLPKLQVCFRSSPSATILRAEAAIKLKCDKNSFHYEVLVSPSVDFSSRFLYLVSCIFNLTSRFSVSATLEVCLFDFKQMNSRLKSFCESSHLASTAVGEIQFALQSAENFDAVENKSLLGSGKVG